MSFQRLQGDMDVDDTNASNDEDDDNDGQDDSEKSTNSNDTAANGSEANGSVRTSERQRRVQASPSRYVTLHMGDEECQKDHCEMFCSSPTCAFVVGAHTVLCDAVV